MDLLQTVRKEGSRGGRSEFKWQDVKDSQHRENYLGHSLMAPVGRWQQGRDLNWYANSKDKGQDEADARKEELRKVKQAEEDAMAKALGLDPPQRAENNANLVELGRSRDVEQAPSGNRDDEASRRSERRRERHDHERHRDRNRDRQRSRSRERRDRRHHERREPDRHRARDQPHRRHRSHSRERSRTRSRSRERRRERHDRYDRHDRHEKPDRRHRSRSPNDQRR